MLWKVLPAQTLLALQPRSELWGSLGKISPHESFYSMELNGGHINLAWLSIQARVWQKNVKDGVAEEEKNSRLYIYFPRFEVH